MKKLILTLGIFTTLASANAKSFVFCESGPETTEAVRALNGALNEKGGVLAAQVGLSSAMVSVPNDKVKSVSSLTITQESASKVLACAVVNF